MGQALSLRPAPELSVIIPTYNEEDNIGTTIMAIHRHKSRRVEVIVTDGFSTDDTRKRARRAGAATVMKVRGGRALQLNAGAANARSSRILFLHADTIVPRSFDTEIVQTLKKPGVVAGAFRLCINSNIRGVRIVERFANWRSSFLQRPYGDQGIFLARSTFEAIGRFPAMTFLDDYEIIRRLSKRGRISISSVPVRTSGRRWELLGVVPTTILNQFIIAAYHCGIPVNTLRDIYRGVLVRAFKAKQQSKKVTS